MSDPIEEYEFTDEDLFDFAPAEDYSFAVADDGQE